METPQPKPFDDATLLRDFDLDLKITPEFNGPSSSNEWLHFIECTATTWNHQQSSTFPIGRCKASLIRKNELGYQFRDEARSLHWPVCSLIWDVFDPDGNVSPSHTEHLVKKGSGIWKDELNEGNLLVIEKTGVRQAYKKNGIASAMIRMIIEKIQLADHTPLFTFAWACGNYPDIHINPSEGSSKTKLDGFGADIFRSEKLFRGLGFRRLGLTQWFCWASDKTHPSHRLAASEDYNPLEPRFPLGSRPRQSPFHEMTVVTPDLQCLEILQNAPSLDEELTKIDDEGNTLLHIAAMDRKPYTLDWLLLKSPAQVQSQRNMLGQTPLDALEATLGKERSWGYPFDQYWYNPRNFAGFNDEDVSCLQFLTDWLDPPFLEIWRMKYGCTCGSCVGGILSARTSLALAETAMSEYHHLLSTLDEDESIIRIYEEFATPGSVNPIHTVARAFLDTILLMKQVLDKGLQPSEKDLLEAWAWKTETHVLRNQEFLDYSIVDAAVRFVTARAEAHRREWVHYKKFGRCVDRLQKLGRCRNDFEFLFVQRLLNF